MFFLHEQLNNVVFLYQVNVIDTFFGAKLTLYITDHITSHKQIIISTASTIKARTIKLMIN